MCRSRQEAKIHPRPRRGCKVSLQPGSQIGPARAAVCGATRGRSNGAAGGALCEATRHSHPPGGSRGSERAGQPANSPSAMPEDAVCGATRGRIKGVAVEEMRGNPEIHRLRCQRIGDSRQLEAPSPVQRKDARRQETRGRIGKLNGTMHDLSNL